MKQRILVVDDEEQVRDLLCFYFRKHGFEASIATSSVETLAALATQRPDLIVLDIGLDEEDGLGVLAKIKQKYPDQRVVMLTGMGLVEDLLQEAQDKGADGYVSKVLPLDELLTTVQRLIAPVMESKSSKL